MCGGVATCHLQGLDNHARYGYSLRVNEYGRLEAKGLCTVAGGRETI